MPVGIELRGEGPGWNSCIQSPVWQSQELIAESQETGKAADIPMDTNQLRIRREKRGPTFNLL